MEARGTMSKTFFEPRLPPIRNQSENGKGGSGAAKKGFPQSEIRAKTERGVVLTPPNPRPIRYYQSVM